MHCITPRIMEIEMWRELLEIVNVTYLYFCLTFIKLTIHFTSTACAKNCNFSFIDNKVVQCSNIMS